MKKIVLFVLFSCLAPLASADIVSVNFTEDARANQNLPTATTAGGGLLEVAANWNNIDGSTGGGTTALVDDSGAASGVSVTWSTGGGGVWGDASANVDADAGVGNAMLVRGYLDDNGATPITIDLTGITYANYDIFLVGSTDGDGGTYVNATIGGTVYSTTGTKGQYGTNANLDASRVWAATGLSGSAVSIALDPRDGANRGSIGGFQIVEVAVPEPGSMVVLGMMGTTLLIRRRRA